MPRTVVLVDDIPEVRTMVRIAFGLESSAGGGSEDGFEIVGEADTGAAAIEAAQRLQPHLVVLDLGLPDMPGRNAFDAIRAAAPQAGIVIYAGGDSDREWYETRNAPFVHKSTSIDELLGALHASDPERLS